MDKLETELIQRLTRIETKLDNYTDFKKKAQEAYEKASACEREIQRMQEHAKWLVRLGAANLLALIIDIVRRGLW